MFLIFRRALCFYIGCIRWAAAGTIDRANGWYWLVGFAIIAFIGWYRELGTLIFPDDFPRSVALGFIAFLLSWIAIFIVRLFFAPGKLYGAAQDRIQLLTEQMVSKINVRLTNSGSGFRPVKTRLRDNEQASGPLSKWAQITVESATSVSLIDCEVHLVSVQRIGKDGAVENLLHEQTLCNWSQADGQEVRRMDIRALVPQAANVFSLHNVPQPRLNMEVSHKKYELEDEIQKPGIYKLGIVVTASGAVSVTKYFELNWGGAFANATFTQIAD